MTHLTYPASNEDLLRNKYAIVDHLSLAQCAGFTGSSFTEVQHIWRDLHVQWAGAFSDACRAIMEALNAPHPDEPRHQLDLERAIKWKFLLPSGLLLRKPPSANGTKAKHLKPIVKRRLNQYDSGDWKTLLEEYESDVVRSQLIHQVDTRTEDDKDMAAIRKAADLLARFQCSKARKHLQSNGLGDHTDEAIIEQMTRKHPARKKPITPLSNEDLEKPRRGISREIFAKQIAGLKHDVAPGLGCLRNEHLLALLLNPDRQMTPRSTSR